jgi:predicted TIM-barrel fold metal-dependent hydrolase
MEIQIPGYTRGSYAHRPGIADELNRFLSSLIGRFPKTAGLATLHPEDTDGEDILRRAHEELGLRGLKLHCHVLKLAPDDPVLFPAYEMVSM